MITNISSELKQHIETYINDIRQNNIEKVIFSCPTKLQASLMDVLLKINITIPEQLYSYVTIVKCLSRQVDNFHMTTFESSSDSETYEFSLPLTTVDLDKLYYDITTEIQNKFLDINICQDWDYSISVGLRLQFKLITKGYYTL